MATPLKAPVPEQIQAILALYERGRVLDAFQSAQAIAPLPLWSGVEACSLAARIAANTGAPRLATRLCLRAWKSDPTHPVAQHHYGLEIKSRRGPLAAWMAMRHWPEHGPATPIQQAEMLALRASIAADLRDFARADELIAGAKSLAPRQPWILLQHAHVYERQDRVEEALAMARAACDAHLNRFYRPGVQVQAQFLQVLDRDDEAVQLLTEAEQHLQNGPVAAQLFSLLSENARWREAEAALERFVNLSPLLEPPARDWVGAQRARCAYHLGNRPEAARLYAQMSDGFHQRVARQLESPPQEPERVQLPVNFVRQHFKTCAPATLAALGRFWGMSAEHLHLAEAMCYDGTPHWQQREWAEQNGWWVREFRMDYPSAVALVTRGIPFALSTVDATSAHMQAVVGFDKARGSLLIRDPGQPYVLEVLAEDFLKRYRPFGPHGTVFLPVDRRSLLQDLSLPEEEAYDDYHRLCKALARHQRSAAAEVLAQMEQRFPDHELVWEARLDLASYDANNSEQVRCLDKLLELFPHNPTRLLRRLGCLREAPRDERIKFLRQVCQHPHADPILHIELARALQGDARCLPEAESWLNRAFRFRRLDTTFIGVRADLCWEQGDLEQATELYRFAANLDGFREGLYQAWFVACRRTRRAPEALVHLQDRFERFGRRSEQPALTLAWALREMEEPARAREVLAEARQWRPDDALLKLRSASILASLGEQAQAETLLQQARGKVRENDALRTAAELAEYRLDLPEVLSVWRQLLSIEPLALDAHSGVARCLARLEGNAAALAHLKSACESFPHHYGLRRMVLDWSRGSDPTAMEVSARELLQVDPADAWAHRERAYALLNLERTDEALLSAGEALQIEPRNSYSHSLLGHIHRRVNHLTEARAHFRRAVELAVDNADAIHGLLESARTDRERLQELEFVEGQLIEQFVQGDGLLAFLELAQPLTDPGKLLQSLRRAHGERSDLWHAWSALISHLMNLGHLQEAHELATQATQRFSHLPRVWLDLARACQLLNDAPGEIKAAERAFEMNPAWQSSTLCLAGALERQGRLDTARTIYERALQHSSNDAQLQACYAHLLWRQRQNDGAFVALETALRLAPAFEWAWSLFLDWAAHCGQLNRVPQFARALTQQRPGETQTWLMLARVLNETESKERLEAINKALELDPRSTEAWDFKADLLASAERFDEAIAACEQGAAICAVDVHILRGRRAWIEARRRQVPEAIRLMQSVLADNLNYTWGWTQLAHWLTQQGDDAQAAAALEQLLRLRPHEGWVYRQLGLLRIRTKQHDAAREAFTNALRVSPTDALAAQNLLELQLEAGRMEEALSTLSLMEIHQPGARKLACEIQVYLKLRDYEQARRAYEKLGSIPDPDPWSMDVATDGFIRAARPSIALSVLRSALRQTSHNPQAGAAAVQVLLATGRYYDAVRFFFKLPKGEAQKRAAPVLAHGLGEAGREWPLRWLLWRRLEVLRADDDAWGQVGYALTRCKRMRAVSHWLADWTERPNVQPWMLFNLCLAYRHLGRYEDSNAIARHVLAQWGFREGSADLRLFLAVEEALAGRVPEAEEHLEHVIVRSHVGHDQDLLALARALVQFQRAPASERPACCKSLCQSMAPQFSAWRLLWSMKDVRRTFRRSGKLFAQQGGGWSARWWFGWKLHWQWMFLPLLPFALALAVQVPIVAAAVLIGLFFRRD